MKQAKKKDVFFFKRGLSREKLLEKNVPQFYQGELLTESTEKGICYTVRCLHVITQTFNGINHVFPSSGHTREKNKNEEFAEQKIYWKHLKTSISHIVE